MLQAEIEESEQREKELQDLHKSDMFSKNLEEERNTLMAAETKFSVLAARVEVIETEEGLPKNIEAEFEEKNQNEKESQHLGETDSTSFEFPQQLEEERIMIIADDQKSSVLAPTDEVTEKEELVENFITGIEERKPSEKEPQGLNESFLEKGRNRNYKKASKKESKYEKPQDLNKKCEIRSSKVFPEMDRPMLLIESTGHDLRINPEAMTFLKELETTIVVIGIVGDYRSGKSFLLNCLAERQKDGFELGDDVTAHTKGIWIWCQPHPFRENTTIIFMDSEGLQDPQKSDCNYDMKIITLCFLLSSTLLYNTDSRIDASLVDKLSFVSKVTKHIQVRTGKYDNIDDDDISLLFPYLVVVLRNFYLKLKISNQEVTPTEYFFHCLKNVETMPAHTNHQRKILRQYFPTHKCSCHVLPIPTQQHYWLSILHLAPKEDVSPLFIEKCKELKNFLVRISKSKNVGCLQDINGHLFSGLVECYVKALVSGEIPCIESALKMTAMKENQRILELCMKNYETKVQILPFPLSQKDLLTAHKDIVNDLTATYKDKIIFDDLFELKEKLQNKLSTAYDLAVALNETASTKKCKKILTDLYKPVKENLQEYMKKGGYEAHKNRLDEIKKQYDAIPEKGVKSDSTLHEFLQKLEDERNTIIAADKKFSVLHAKEEAFLREREQEELREKMLKEEMERSNQREKELKELNERIEQSLKQEMIETLAKQEEKFKVLMGEKDELIKTMEESYRSELRKLTEKIEELENRRSCIIS